MGAWRCADLPLLAERPALAFQGQHRVCGKWGGGGGKAVCKLKGSFLGGGGGRGQAWGRKEESRRHGPDLTLMSDPSHASEQSEDLT